MDEQEKNELISSLQPCWDRYSSFWVERLISDLSFMGSGQSISLNGVQRDLLLYALARAALTTPEHKPSP